MQKEQIDRFVTLAGLEMPALISPGKFQEAEIYEDSAVLTFLLPKVYPLEELIDELEKRCGKRVIGNKSASGTEIIEELGEEEINTGAMTRR